MEDKSKEETNWALAPSILSVLAYISGNPALQFLTFLLALGSIIQKTKFIPKTPDEVILTSPRRRVVKIKKARKTKHKRRPQKVTPELRLMIVRFKK